MSRDKKAKTTDDLQWTQQLESQHLRDSFWVFFLLK